MTIEITSSAATWFLPFVFPICLWVMWSDLRSMRIPNKAVLALTVVFLVVGLIALPLAEYPWRLLTLVVVLIIGMLANAAGLMGAGDSKFIAAAAPFIDPGDGLLLLFIFMASMVACYTTHTIAKNTALRRLAPNWESWDKGPKFPMGTALGSSLILYLVFGVIWGP